MDVHRVTVVLILHILGAHVRRGDDLEAKVDGSGKEVNEETSGMETGAVAAPRTPCQSELETVTFSTRSVDHRHTKKIVLQYASLQHFLVSGAEVDESKIACAGERDAGETGGCWNTFTEEEHALALVVVLMVR